MSSILETLVRYKREILHYGVAFLLMVSALYLGRMGAALILFVGALAMAAFDIWLRPYQIRGEFVFKQREVVHREQIKAAVADWTARWRKPEEGSKSEETEPEEAKASRLLEEAGLPPVESPPPLPTDLKGPAEEKDPPSVTHST